MRDEAVLRSRGSKARLTGAESLPLDGQVTLGQLLRLSLASVPYLENVAPTP